MSLRAFTRFLPLLYSFFQHVDTCQLPVKEVQSGFEVSYQPKLLHEVIHQLFFLYLLVDKPLQETIGGVITFLAGKFDDAVDGSGYSLFLPQRAFHDLLRRTEAPLRCRDGKKLDPAPPAMNKLIDFHGVSHFFFGVVEDPLRETLESQSIEVVCSRQIGLVRLQFHIDLLIQGALHIFDKHASFPIESNPACGR